MTSFRTTPIKEILTRKKFTDAQIKQFGDSTPFDLWAIWYNTGTRVEDFVKAEFGDDIRLASIIKDIIIHTDLNLMKDKSCCIVN